MVEEQDEPDEEKEEFSAVDEALSTRHAVNMYHCILVAQKSIPDKEPPSDGSPQK